MMPYARVSRPDRCRSVRSLPVSAPPAAIDIAPATRPAPPTNTLPRVPCVAATPNTKLAVETMPSFTPHTAARNHPMSSFTCRSQCPTGTVDASFGSSEDMTAPGRLHSSRGGGGAERALNGPSEVRFTKRLLNNHRAWPKRSNP